MDSESDRTIDAKKELTESKILCHKLGIDPMELVSWNENLRVWLTQTILRPLVSEIEKVNVTLPRLGITDCSIGAVALDRIRKIAVLPQVISSLPSLSTLVPYLEVCTDQTYLIKRFY